MLFFPKTKMQPFEPFSAQGPLIRDCNGELGVHRSESGAPRDAHDHPAVDAKVLAEGLDVGDEMVCGVGGQTDIGGAREKRLRPHPR